MKSQLPVPSTITVEELFQEEAAALTVLIDELENEVLNTDWSDTKFYELREEIIRLNHVIEYFALRIEGFYEIRKNDEMLLIQNESL